MPHAVTAELINGMIHWLQSLRFRLRRRTTYDVQKVVSVYLTPAVYGRLDEAVLFRLRDSAFAALDRAGCLRESMTFIEPEWREGPGFHPGWYAYAYGYAPH